jgi:hypothetical protein
MLRRKIEAIREGIVGKILGYTALFAMAFLLVLVILIGIERYQPK